MNERDLSAFLELSRIALEGDSTSARTYVARMLAEAPPGDGSHGDLRERLAGLLLEDRQAKSRPRSRRPQPRNAGTDAGVARDDDVILLGSTASPRMSSSAWDERGVQSAWMGEGHTEVTRIERVGDAEVPVLRRSSMAVLASIIEERRHVEALRRHHIEPTRSLLLTGAPGVGKTMSARYLAAALGLPLVSMDLALLMSSYLGETGRNIRRALESAKHAPCVFLIDEIDALGKRRGDAAEIGELKRIVNVLLLELERWPSESLLIGATNHPELLDRAIWRRFDRVLSLGVPSLRGRREILLRTLAMHGKVATERAVAMVVVATNGASAADLAQLAREAVRESVIGALSREASGINGSADQDALQATSAPMSVPGGEPLLDDALVRLAMRRLSHDARKHPEARAAFCALATSELGLSQREIARILGISHVSVGRHLQGWQEEQPSTAKTGAKPTPRALTDKTSGARKRDKVTATGRRAPRGVKGNG